MRDVVTCAWRELSRRKGRTATNVFGYFLAVSTLVLLVTLLLFSRDAADEVLEQTGTFFTVYSPATCEVPCYIPPGHSVSEAFVGTGGIYTYSMADIALKNPPWPLTHVKRYAPYVLFRFLDANENSTVTVGGFDPRDADVVGPNAVAESDMLGGDPKNPPRFLRPEDTGVVLVERTYAEPRALQQGNKVRVAGKTFTIIALVDTTHSTRAARADMYMTRPDLQKLIALRIPDHATEYNMVVAQATSVKALAKAKEEMSVIGSAASGSSCHKPAINVLGVNERSVWLLTLLVGLFTLVSAAKSQLASVIERRRDIGILKAIGWTSGAVTGQVFIESVLMAGIGGALGCLTVALALMLVPIKELAQIQTNMPLTITLDVLKMMGYGMALALVGGGLAGSIPAFIAARQRPAIALRQV